MTTCVYIQNRFGTRWFAVVSVTVVTVVGLCLAPVAAQAALVGYWNFDEGTGTAANDFSPNGNDGTLISGGGFPQWVIDGGNTGATGDHALLFGNGNPGSRVGIPTSPSFATLTSNNAFTFATWALETGGSNYGHIFVTTPDFSNRTWLFQTDGFGGDQAYVWSTTDGSWQKPLGFLVDDGQWQHFALTYDGTTMRAYKNGALAGTYGVGSTFPAFAELYLGGFIAGNSSFNGRLDDMVIFNSLEDIASIMDGTHPELNPAPPVPATPEPSTVILATLGLLSLGMTRRRRRR